MVVIAALFVGLAVPGAVQAAPNYDTTCSAAPDQGAGRTLRVSNMSCRHGSKVVRKSAKKFCKEHNDCLIDFEQNINKVYRGTVRRNGWKCKVTIAWEYARVKCRKGDMRVISIGGA